MSAASITADQQCSSIGDPYLDGAGTNAPEGQTFIPTQSSVVGFAVYIQSTNVVSTSMTASVLSGGVGEPVVGSIDFTVPAGFGSPAGNWFTVQFPSGIPVTPNSIYALGLQDNSGSSGIRWYACSAPYANGCGYSNGVCQANSWGFIEYSGDFSIGLSTTGITIAQGSTSSLTVLVDSQSSFASPVLLSLFAPTGVAGSFNVNPGTSPTGIDSIATTSGGTSAATLSIFVPATVAVGTYPLTVTASSGPISHSTTLTLTVTPPGTHLEAVSPDFIAQPFPATINLSPGAFRSTSLIISSVNSFNSEVDLTTSWVDPPANVIVSLPSSVSVPADGAGTSTLTLNAGNSASGGTYTLLITASSGGIEHSTQVTVGIAATPAVLVPVAALPGFTTQSSSATLSLSPGDFQSIALVISSLSGFNSRVALSVSWVGVAPSGVSVIVPSSVIVPTGGTANSTLMLNAADSVSAGAYTLLITATGAGISHSTQVNVQVNSPASY